jgi:hypothetical protein
MKRYTVLFILFTCMAICVCSSANAQFWKKKSERKHHKHKNTEDTTGTGDNIQESGKERKKEYKRKEREERKKEKSERRKKRRQPKEKQPKAAKKAIAPPVVVRQEVSWPPTTVRSRYRVEVLSPMYLDEIAAGAKPGKNKIPDKAIPGLAFYEGLQIAADSLKKAGFNIDIYIHDATSATESAGALAASGRLDTADLIIGAVQVADIPTLAELAKKKRVNFISALSPSDGGVKENPYFTMLEPSLKSHCEYIARDISQKYTGRKATILHRDLAAADENAYKYLANAAAKLNYNQLLCNGLPGKDSLHPLFDGGGTNILIVPVLDIAFADSLLHDISANFPEMRFEVYGMPSWYNAAFVDLNNMPNVSINITYPFNFQTSPQLVKYIARTCKEDFGQKATELVLRGYEAMFWYANLLKQYGTIFNEHYNDVTAAPFTKFDVKLQWDNSGHVLFNENNHLNLESHESVVTKMQ